MGYKRFIFTLMLGFSHTYGTLAFSNDSLSRVTEDNYLRSSPPSKKYFDVDRWQKAREGTVYEAKEPLTPPAQVPDLPFSLEWIKYLIYGVAILVLVVALTFLVLQINFKRQPRRAKLSAASQTLDNNPQKEEDLLEMDFEPQIEEALQHQDFGIATRLLYLLALQRLVRAKLLQWSKDQTNRHILYQLHHTPFTTQLQSVFRTYEMVWFGQKDIDETGFSNFQATHKILLRHIDGKID